MVTVIVKYQHVYVWYLHLPYLGIMSGGSGVNPDEPYQCLWLEIKFKDDL